MFGDRLDHYCARGLTGPFPCSGNTPIMVTFPTITVLSKCYDHYRARGLSRPLFGVCSPRLHVIRTHIQSRDISLDLATRLIFHLPASLGAMSVRCTCWCILFCLCGNCIFYVSGNYFGTLAPRAYVTYYQARGLSGHTSPCGECVSLLDPRALNNCKD